MINGSVIGGELRNSPCDDRRQRTVFRFPLSRGSFETGSHASHAGRMAPIRQQSRADHHGEIDQPDPPEPKPGQRRDRCF